MLFQKDSIEIEGTWVDSWGYILEVDGDSVFWRDASGAIFQECKISYYSNLSFNAREYENSDCGYALLYYSSPSEYIPHAQNKYGILRWKDLEGNSLSFSEAYYNPDNTGSVYFSYKSDAINNMTEENMAFFYTEGAVKQ